MPVNLAMTILEIVIYPTYFNQPVPVLGNILLTSGKDDN